MKDPVLKPGVALVLAGPQGCGKTALARRIALAYGRSAEVQIEELETDPSLASVLHSSPRVLIIEGLPRFDSTRERLKALITAETVQVRQPCSHVRKAVKAPQIILCTHEKVPASMEANVRFHVVKMPAGVFA